MKRILIVSTHPDVRERMERYCKNNQLELDLVYLVEFYGEDGAQKADGKFFPIDDLRNRPAIEDAIRQIKALPPFDAVVHTDEYAVYLAGELREVLGLSGLKRSDAIYFRDKVAMKEALKDTVRIPKVYSFSELKDLKETDFPIVTKPRIVRRKQRGSNIAK